MLDFLRFVPCLVGFFFGFPVDICCDGMMNSNKINSPNSSNNITKATIETLSV